MMKKRTKRVLLSSSLLFLMIFLSGCMRYDSAGNPTGVIYEFLVVPTQQAIVWLANLFGGSYGFAIIAITILVRLIIFPLNISQQKKTIVQQIKMAGVKPVMDEIQREMKETNDPAEKQELQTELMQVYRDNDISMLGGIGCLPLLIQLPIFTALFQAVNLSPEIKNATFLGIELGERSILLAILAGIVYYAQSVLMMQGMPEEQKKQSRSMMLMNPLMILFFSLTGPAGLSLYWLAGGVIAVVQSYFTNQYYKPKLEAELEAKNGPVKKVTRQKKRKDVTPVSTRKSTPSNSPFAKKNNVKRNSGKQNGRNTGKQNKR